MCCVKLVSTLLGLAGKKKRGGGRGQGVTVIHIYGLFKHSKKFANPRETWGLKGGPKLTPVVGEEWVGSRTGR